MRDRNSLGRTHVSIIHTLPIGNHSINRPKITNPFRPPPDLANTARASHIQAAAITHFANVQLFMATPLTG